MEILGAFVESFLRPLSTSLVLAAMVAGLFFGAIYNRGLNLPTTLVYHKLMAGWGFLFFIFLFRLGTPATQNVAGWLGIAALWAIFCLFIWIGEVGSKKIY